MKQRHEIKKLFLLAMIGSLSISALIGIYIFLQGSFGEVQTRLLLSTLAIGGYSLTGLCCATLYEKKRAMPFAIAGMVISAAGLVYTLLIIWPLLSDQSWRALITLIILAISSAHVCLLLLISAKNRTVRYALSATLLFIGVVAIMLIAFTFNDYSYGDFFFRLLGVFGILDALGTIITPILTKIYPE